MADIFLIILFSLIIIIALSGNLLLCVAVYWDKKLRRNEENIFYVSLAISDLLMSVLVMSLAMANDILGYWPLGPIYCQLWICCDIACSTASILNLCAIALFRYWNISHPLTCIKYVYLCVKNIRRKKAYSVAIIWILSVLIGSIQLIFDFAQNYQLAYTDFQNLTIRSERNRSCQLLLKPFYALGSSLCSFFAPATIMVLLYTRLYLYARRHSRNMRRQLKEATTLLFLHLVSMKPKEIEPDLNPVIVHMGRGYIRTTRISFTMADLLLLNGRCGRISGNQYIFVDHSIGSIEHSQMVLRFLDPEKDRTLHELKLIL
ncbi:unnamed protein product [Dracunculus medinensis]|uniref:G_PROTEIN_RECEP_F1_2 domain-containing protein n=1 Tax=Dracunculus medinensis TaxID=318479 RepID=A0A0N4U4W5_DRAME|nr:unnamed protein product [Dracunculus medinensis]